MTTTGEPYPVVAGVLERWEPEPDTSMTDRQTLRVALDAALPGVRVETRPGTELCDVVVGGTIGVTLCRGFTTDHAREFRSLEERRTLGYDHLVIYGYDIPPARLDAWRASRWRLSGSVAGTSVEFLRRTPEEEADERGRRSLWQYADPETALVVVLSAITVDMLRRMLSGGASFYPMLLFIILVTLLVFGYLLWLHNVQETESARQRENA